MHCGPWIILSNYVHFNHYGTAVRWIGFRGRRLVPARNPHTAGVAGHKAKILRGTMYTVPQIYPDDVELHQVGRLNRINVKGGTRNTKMTQ